nr:hypothetical protein [Helicobacter valdiviensis]
MQNLKLQIAKGLDENLEDEDRKQELYVCKFVIINGVKKTEIKNFTLVASSEVLRQKITNLTKNAKKIIFICSDYEGYKGAKNSLYQVIQDIYQEKFENNNDQKVFEIVYLNQIDKDELQKEQNFEDKNQNLSSVKKVIYKNMKLLNDVIEAKDDNTLREILNKNNKANIHKFLMEVQQELIKLLNNIKESHYYEVEIKPYIKDTLNKVFEDISKNLVYSDSNDMWKQIIRAVAKFFINLFVSLIDIGNPISFVKRSPFIFIVYIKIELDSALSEVGQYMKDRYYYDFAYPLLELITTYFYPIIAFCNEELLSDALIIDDKILLDFSSYIEAPSVSLYRNSFYQINLDEDFKGYFDNFLTRNYEFKCKNSDNTLLINTSLNNSNTPLKQALHIDIYNLNHFFYAEYPDLTSSLLVEMILDKKDMDKTDTTKMGKNYLFITNPPQLSNAGLCEDLYQKKLGATIKYRPKSPSKAEILSSETFPSKRDYGSYFIERDVKKEDAFILQLCPFIKLEGRLYEAYKAYLEDKKVFGWFYSWTKPFEDFRGLYQEDLNYLDSFFRMPSELEDITKTEKSYIEGYLKTFGKYLDDINKTAINTHRDCYEYSALSLFLIASTLFVVSREFSFNYEQSIDIFPINEVYQILGSNNNGTLKIIRKNSYIKIDGKTFYIFLSRGLMQHGKPDSEVIYLFELAYVIFELNYTEEDQIYANFLKMLNEDSYNEPDLKENNQIDKSLPSREDLDKSIEEIMADNELARISLDITFFNILSQLFPFVEYFMGNPDCFKKMILFFVSVGLDKKHYGNNLFRSFTMNFYKELGIFYALKPRGHFMKINPNSIKQVRKAFLYQIGESYYYFNKLEYATDLKKSKAFSRLDKAKQATLIFKVKKQLVIDFSINMGKNLGVDLLANFATSFVDSLLLTNYERLKYQYELLMHDKLTYKYDAPLAVQKEEYMTYPLLVASRFMSFDLSKFIFGSLLCTGGLNYYPSITCATTSSEAREFALKRLLSYIILDEKRSAFAKDRINEGKYILNDKEFFEKNNIELRNCDVYKLEHFQKKEEYKTQHPIIKQHPILAYNEVIQILYEYANGLYNNIQDEKGNFIEDRQKARRLMENLEAIGQHNLEVMYSGINNEKINKGKANRKDKENFNGISKIRDYSNQFIGRLATTIIMENGLYIG